MDLSWLQFVTPFWVQLICYTLLSPVCYTPLGPDFYTLLGPVNLLHPARSRLLYPAGSSLLHPAGSSLLHPAGSILNIQFIKPCYLSHTYTVKSLEPCRGVWGIRTLASEAKYFAFAKFYFPWQYKVLRVDGASHWNICDRMPDV